jgi:hypothetical protein
MFPTPSTFSAKKRTLMTLNQQMKEISKLNTSLINRTSNGAGTKNYLKELRSI